MKKAETERTVMAGQVQIVESPRTRSLCQHHQTNRNILSLGQNVYCHNAGPNLNSLPHGETSGQCFGFSEACNTGNGSRSASDIQVRRTHNRPLYNIRYTRRVQKCFREQFPHLAVARSIDWSYYNRAEQTSGAMGARVVSVVGAVVGMVEIVVVTILHTFHYLHDLQKKNPEI